MAGPTFGPSGLQIQTATEIQADLSTALQAQFGVSLQTLNGSTVIGQLVSALAQTLATYQEGIDAAYQANTLDGAAGVNLDRLVEALGLTRNVATSTIVPVTFHNAKAAIVTVPQGALITLGASNAQFVTMAAVAVPASGAAAGQIIALVAGPTQVSAGQTTWQINTPFADSNFITLTNSDGTPGLNQETDADLRTRVLFSAHLPGNSTLEAIRSNLADLDGVDTVRVYENTSVITGIATPVVIPLLPGKSFVACVAGPTAALPGTIAPIIYGHKPAGIGTYGNTSTTVTDSEGYAVPISYEQATGVECYVEVTLTGVSSTLYDTIRAAIISYIGSGSAAEGVGIGGTLVRVALEAVIYDASKVNGVSTCKDITGLKFDTVNPPVNTTNFAIPWNQYPMVLNSAHVVILP